MTTAQYKKRQEHKLLAAEVKMLRIERGRLLGELRTSQQKLAEKEKWTVKLGMERDLREPLYMLNVAIHPREFQHAYRVRSNGGFSNVNDYAGMVAQDTAYKIERLLTEFCAGGVLQH